MLGIIGGTSLSDLDEMALLEKREKETSYNKVTFFQSRDFVFVPRHSFDEKLPPHAIDFHSIMDLFSLLEVDCVLGVNSVGSLHRDLNPGTLFVPYDFFSPWNIPTFFDENRVHATPSINNELRSLLIETCKEKDQSVEEGVYVQSMGPRLETFSEIDFFSSIGHVVGMTMASEATLACELDLKYVSLCTVDNYANGVVSEVEFSDILEGASSWDKTLSSIVSDFAGRI